MPLSTNQYWREVNFEDGRFEAANLADAQELFAGQLTNAEALLRAQLDSDLRTEVIIERLGLFDRPKPAHSPHWTRP